MVRTETSQKIKLIIFDLDGVLMDSRELHYEALNRALHDIDPKYVIQLEEHLAKYDGRPTTAKLNMLSEEKGLPKELHDQVWKSKQDKTFEVINDTYKFDNRLRSVLSGLKERGFTLYCASNSIYKTLQLMLLRKGLLEYFDFILSCEDVLHPKPFPDVYLTCIMRSGLSTKETMIVEDSHVGRKSALLSGAHLCPVEDPSNVTLDRLLMRVEHINQSQVVPDVFASANINIAIPMATSYESSKDSELTYSGPLLEVNGRPLLKIIVENISLNGNYVFIPKQSDYEKLHLKYVLQAICPGSNVLTSLKETKSALHTLLLAADSFDNDTPLLVANGHQFLDWDSEKFHQFCIKTEADGVIATFSSNHPRFSYVALGSDGFISEVAEKKPISSVATCGVYYWKRGSDFVKYAKEAVVEFPEGGAGCSMIAAYEKALQDSKKLASFKCKYSWQLKFPKDLEAFYRSRKNPTSAA